MTPKEMEVFAKAMARIFSIYGDEVTENMLSVWQRALAEYDLRDITRAMQLHVKDPQRGRFKPVPADIIFHLTDTIPKEKRVERALLAEERHALADPVHNAMYMADNDRKLGLLTDEQHTEKMAALRRKLFEIDSDERFQRLLAPLAK